jgi:adenylate kinase family enzyme|tara:strand:+ start:286 stop:636 length:351 start_codon:yes stop_codon:yes gene_type:complete
MIKLKDLLKEEKEQLNERIKTPFMVHPEDPDQTERHWKKVFKELAKGHPHPIDYGPRESDQYDWNDRRNYKKSIEEYNKYMNKVADNLNKSLDEMNNIWKTWTKIRDKYRKKDRSR